MSLSILGILSTENILLSILIEELIIASKPFSDLNFNSTQHLTIPFPISGPELERLRGGEEQPSAGRDAAPAPSHCSARLHRGLRHPRQRAHRRPARRHRPHLRYRQQRPPRQPRRQELRMRRLGQHDGRRGQR